ncbi:MAG: hypothetical protein IMZ43_09885 [Thermoplasmata archaeon]|nr:hypothetical protein [Thermoplasmata archaeon]
MTKAKRKTIRICSREWTLRADKRERGGARLQTFGLNGAGNITIGTRGQCRRSIIEGLAHEVVEGILTHDGQRWKEGSGNEKILFCFDHNYLDKFSEKLIDAFVSCGLIDPNKKVV